jgi:outer membrane protein TolC
MIPLRTGFTASFVLFSLTAGLTAASLLSTRAEGAWGAPVSDVSADEPSTQASASPSVLPAATPPITGVDEGEALTLSLAISRALVNNPDVRDQHMALRSAELYYEDAWDRMYLPSVALNANSSASKTLSHVPGKNTDTLGATKDEHGYPGSSVDLTLGSYTLFNFGRDKILLDQSKLDWNRTREAFEEFKRNIKFQVIIQFWTLKTTLDKLDASNRSVEVAQAIVDLQESRLPLGKASQNDISSSTIDLLNAKNQRDQNETLTKNTLWSFNILLGDSVGTKYRIEEDISFLPIKVTEQILFDTYLSESPNMKSARKDLTKSHLNLELQEKSLLPLPTIKVSGVTASYTNGYYGNKADLYTQNSGNTNIDVIGSVNLSLPILGPGGLMGHRIVEQAQIQMDQSELRLRNTANRDRGQVFQLVQNIRQFEVTVSNNRQSYKSSVSVLEDALASFSNGKTVSRLDIKDAINQARDSEIQLRDAILQHLSYKTQLAAFIGVDYLPRME